MFPYLILTNESKEVCKAQKLKKKEKRKKQILWISSEKQFLEAANVERANKTSIF